MPQPNNEETVESCQLQMRTANKTNADADQDNRYSTQSSIRLMGWLSVHLFMWLGENIQDWNAIYQTAMQNLVVSTCCEYSS